MANHRTCDCMTNPIQVLMLIPLAVTLSLTSAIAQDRPNRVNSRLIADTTAIQPGQPFRAGVLFTIPEKSHIYWRHSGDSGFPTEIEWELPEGFAAGTLQWPAPERFTIEEIDDVSYGYAGEVMLFVTITPPTLEAPVSLRAKVKWLVCLEDGECIPEDAALEMTLAPGDAQPVNEEAFYTYADYVPVTTIEDAPIRAGFADGGKELVVTAIAPWDIVPLTAQFFPYAGPRWNTQPTTGENPREARITASEPGNAVAGVLAVSLRDPSSGIFRVARIRVDTVTSN